MSAAARPSDGRRFTQTHERHRNAGFILHSTATDPFRDHAIAQGHTLGAGPGCAGNPDPRTNCAPYSLCFRQYDVINDVTLTEAAARITVSVLYVHAAGVHATMCV